MKLLQQNYVKYGLIMTSILVLCLVYMEATGQNLTFEKSPAQALFMIVAPIVVLSLGIQAKKKLQKNKLIYKQGVIEGFKISLVYGLISPFVFLIYYLFINPPIVEYAKTLYQLPNASDSMIISLDMFVQFIMSIIGGTIFSALISLFLKSKK